MDDQVTKDFVDRAIESERELTDEKFRSRDNAIKLLADNVKGQKGVYLAIGLVFIGGLLNLVWNFLVN